MKNVRPTICFSHCTKRVGFKLFFFGQNIIINKIIVYKFNFKMMMLSKHLGALHYYVEFNCVQLEPIKTMKNNKKYEFNVYF